MEPEPTGNKVDAPTLARVLCCDERTVHMLARKGLCVRAGRNCERLSGAARIRCSSSGGVTGAVRAVERERHRGLTLTVFLDQSI